MSAEKLIFSDRFIKALPAKTKDYFKVEYSATRGTGRFALFVEPSGRKSFKFQYHSKNKRKFIPIGDFRQNPDEPGFGLADARTKFNKLSELYQELNPKGIDLKDYLIEQQRAVERAKQELAQRGTFRQLLENYIADMRSRGCRTTDKVDYWFTLYVRDHWPQMMDRPAGEITSQDITDILRRIHKEGSGTKSKYRKGRKKGATAQVNHIRRCLHAAFQFGLTGENDPRDLLGLGIRYGLEYNPVSGVKVVTEWDRVGERTLEFDEIKTLWGLLSDKESINLVASSLVKFCLVTGGQRPGEILRCGRECYDREAGLLTIPAEISKNGIDHVVPLTQMAIGILEEVDTISKNSAYPFPALSDLKKPYSVMSLNTAIRRFCEVKEFERFTPRDLRRTAESRMAESKIPQEIRDRIQNHNIKNDVTNKHYNRYDYLEPKRKALDSWARKLKAAISRRKEDENIVQMVR